MPSRAARYLTPCAVALLALAVPAAASAERYASRTLSVGSQGSDVKRLQRYVTLEGHSTTRDGEFGARTALALRLTERDLELKVDGVATPREQRRIRRAILKPGTGGASYVAPPPPDEVVPGAKGTVGADGFAVAPESAPQAVKDVIAAGNKIAKTPYKWGGGHGTWNDTGYDCSGSVSYALHGGGLLNTSMVSGAFAQWGDSGPGRWITIYGNASHVYMVVAGLRFDTSARSQTGSRWTTQMRSSSGFAITHPVDY